MTDAALVASLEKSLANYRHCARWWIACSGGVDSMVLLHVVAALKNTPPSGVIHINHQLHPQAGQWATFVRSTCDWLGIECVIKTVVIDRNGGEGIEAAARRGRYKIFDAIVGADELLLQAHHRDDQVETFFLRLLRGAGITGLSAMPVTRTLEKGQLLRPLLSVTRADIVAYARLHKLEWVEDNSNDSLQFDRNFLRKNILPLLGQRWSDYRETVAQVVAHFAETDAVLREYAAEDLKTLLRDDGSIDGNGLLRFTSARQRVVLRYWLQQSDLPLPGRAQLDEILQMPLAAEDAEPCVRWADIEVRRFQGRMHVLPTLPPLVDFDMPWSPNPVSRMPDGYGELMANVETGQGLRTDRDYRVRNRRGGERCHPLARAHSQTLKKLLQEAQIPPWWRDRVPLLFCGDELAAVGDLWICRGFEAAPGQPGWVPQWRRPHRIRKGFIERFR